MANKCELCNKGGLTGNRVSHSNIKTKRVQHPNIKRVHAVVAGKPVHLRVCTRCLRSGYIQKAA
ncbi:MAG: 50S ribosomal protein L28 [Polyangia bacterium]